MLGRRRVVVLLHFDAGGNLLRRPRGLSSGTRADLRPKVVSMTLTRAGQNTLQNNTSIADTLRTAEEETDNKGKNQGRIQHKLENTHDPTNVEIRSKVRKGRTTKNSPQ